MYGFHCLVKIFCTNHIKDTQCGFKLYKAYVAKNIFSDLKTNGWAHDVEVLYKADLQGIKIYEMPLTWKNVDDSHVNVFTDSFKMFWEVLKISIIIRFSETFISPFKK